MMAQMALTGPGPVWHGIRGNGVISKRMISSIPTKFIFWKGKIPSSPHASLLPFNKK
jgi:hypothetical protein